MRQLLESDVEKAIVTLLFGYRVPSLAVAAMEAAGDQAASRLFEKIHAEWMVLGEPPALSHKVGGRHLHIPVDSALVADVADSLISAYDESRLARTGALRPQLRNTIDRAFDLRAKGREQTLEDERRGGVDLNSLLWNTHVAALPLEDRILAKLRGGGVIRLKDLAKAPATHLIEILRLTPKETRSLNAAIVRHITETGSSERPPFIRILESAAGRQVGVPLKLNAECEMASIPLFRAVVLQRRDNDWQTLIEMTSADVDVNPTGLVHMLVEIQSLKTIPVVRSDIFPRKLARDVNQAAERLMWHLSDSGITSRGDVIRCTQRFLDEAATRSSTSTTVVALVRRLLGAYFELVERKCFTRTETLNLFLPYITKPASLAQIDSVQGEPD